MDINSIIANNRLRIKVRPGARVSELLKIENNTLHIAIAAKAEDGKANAEVERFLSKLTRRKASIKSGFTSKEKLVMLEPATSLYSLPQNRSAAGS